MNWLETALLAIVTSVLTSVFVTLIQRRMNREFDFNERKRAQRFDKQDSAVTEYLEALNTACGHCFALRGWVVDKSVPQMQYVAKAADSLMRLHDAYIRFKYLFGNDPIAHLMNEADRVSTMMWAVGQTAVVTEKPDAVVNDDTKMQFGNAADKLSGIADRIEAEHTKMLGQA